MVSPASSLTESMSWYVINQHWERKYVEISTNTSIASSDPDVISFMRSKKFLRSPNPSPSRKWWRNFPNLYLKWGFVRVFYNFCEQKRELYFPNHNNWFYRPDFLIYIFSLTNYEIFQLIFFSLLLFF